jgi:hypothetical protein
MYGAFKTTLVIYFVVICVVYFLFCVLLRICVVYDTLLSVSVGCALSVTVHLPVDSAV